MSTQNPDPRPGNYYVTVVREFTSAVALTGPYSNHADALAAVDEARRIAMDIDPKAVWYAYGTARLPDDYRLPGLLNRLGLMECAL